MKAALVGAALLASALASPAAAQEVISNPGYCAQFYPNANCQNKGPGNPYTGSYWRGGWHNGYAWMGPRAWRHKHRHHRAY
jgi:opacity protein-like surface antigen